MWLLKLSILEGRTPEQKHELMRELTQAASEHLGANPSQVRLLLEDVPADHWAVGGQPIGGSQ